MAGILIVCALLLIHASPYAAHSGHTVFLPWVSTPPIPLPNGDFESQPVIWSFLPEDAPLIFAQNELPEGTVPRSGTRVAWLGDQGDQSQSHRTEISQTVTLPGNDPVLRFWVWMQSGEPCDMTRDQLRVYSNGELSMAIPHVNNGKYYISYRTWANSIKISKDKFYHIAISFDGYSRYKICVIDEEGNQQSSSLTQEMTGDYEINEKIINLSEPLLSEEVKKDIDDTNYSPIDPSDRDLKNVYRIISKNGMTDMLDEHKFGNLFSYFERIRKTEIEYFKKCSNM